MHNLKSKEVDIRKYQEELNSQKDEINRLKSLLNSSQINSPSINSSFNDTCRFSGFSLDFPTIKDKEEIPKNSYIKISYNKPTIAKVCTNQNELDHTLNINNLNYITTKKVDKQYVLIGVNGYKLDYENQKIIKDPQDPLNQSVSDEELNKLVPQRLTPEQFTQILQMTKCSSCIKLVFKELYSNHFSVKNELHNKPTDTNPQNNKTIPVFVKPLNRLELGINNRNQILRGGSTSGGFFEKKDQEEVINLKEFKKIKNTIDSIVIKLNNYKKTLEIEENWEKKYENKLSNIDRLIHISKKINALYEGTTYEKMKVNVSSVLSGIKDKIKKRRGEAQQKSPFKLKSGGDGNVNSDLQENKDRNVKPLTKEKCKKLRKYLDEFSQLLVAIDNDEGDPIIEDIKSDISNLSKKSDFDNLSPSKNGDSLFDKIMNMKRNYTNSDSDTYKTNATDILTKTTMVIYDTLMISIIIICIIVYVLFVINIIKFLYQCFLEVGNSQHNNLLSGNTLRYKLLGYVIYINNCNLPSLFSSFNSVDTPSSTFIRLTDVLKNYFTNNPGKSGDDTFESIFGELGDIIKFQDTPEIKVEKKFDDWRRDTQEGQQSDDKTLKAKKKEFLDSEIELDQTKKKRI